jgi:hypothetical protein
LPAEIARELHRRTQYVQSRLSEAAADLVAEIAESEARAERGRIKLKQAFYDRFGVWPEKRGG